MIIIIIIFKKNIFSSRAYHAGAKPPPKGIIKEWQFWLI